jgi:hypothetical protein
MMDQPTDKEKLKFEVLQKLCSSLATVMAMSALGFSRTFRRGVFRTLEDLSEEVFSPRSEAMVEPQNVPPILIATEPSKM